MEYICYTVTGAQKHAHIQFKAGRAVGLAGWLAGCLVGWLVFEVSWLVGVMSVMSVSLRRATPAVQNGVAYILLRGSVLTCCWHIVGVQRGL